ncbi:MAG: Crp/Fnr family transcriptional regulator [Vampirovibrionales bacterium]|nr:Crp/Fnr family transcriptional regulator [Vampirovibrionales bacterium]
MSIESIESIETIDAIRSIAFFAGLSQEDVSLIAGFTQPKRYSANELIFGEGDAATAFYWVRSGRVQVYKIGPDGKEMILHLFAAGDTFAEFPIFGGEATYPANALCLEDTTVLRIDGPAFRALAETRPAMLLKMLSQFSLRLREFNQRIEDLSLRNVDARLAKYLLSVSENTPARAAITVQKKTLAAILATIPETLSRSFRKLSQKGMIEMQGHEVIILNRDGLLRLAEGP